MNIIYDYPPNYKAIAAAFNIKDHQNVIFTYGNDLYVPAGERIIIDKPLTKHEETHSRQQKAIGIETWWERFLEDPGFRFQQELEAYRNQYRAMAGLSLADRLGYLDHICKDLSGEIYGNIVTFEEAKAAITEGIVLKHTRPTAHNLDARKLKKRQRQNRRKGRK